MTRAQTILYAFLFSVLMAVIAVPALVASAVAVEGVTFRYIMRDREEPPTEPCMDIVTAPVDGTVVTRRDVDKGDVYEEVVLVKNTCSNPVSVTITINRPGEELAMVTSPDEGLHEIAGGSTKQVDVRVEVHSKGEDFQLVVLAPPVEGP